MNRIKAPSYLSSIGKKVFINLVQYLQENDKFKEIDTLLIEQFATAYESYRANYKLIKKEGEVLWSDKGNRYLHPAKSALAQSVNTMQTLAKSLGIGEYNRKLAGFSKVEKEDEFIDFLKNEDKS